MTRVMADKLNKTLFALAPFNRMLQTCLNTPTITFLDHICNFYRSEDKRPVWQVSHYSYFTFPTSMGKPRKIGNLNS
jgi:hypothetical protein